MIAILDYDAGNLTSVELAVRHVGGTCAVTRDPDAVDRADRVIFPGVGAARHCMDNLRRLGLADALRRAIDGGRPVLAICIGIQLLFERSEEDGGVDCLGILPGAVARFAFPDSAHVKVPHMGWNEVRPLRPHPLLRDLPAGSECYFVHSYHPLPKDAALAVAETEYADFRFVSAVGRGNLFATQFHPEKSGEAGLSILRSFLTWDGGESAG